LCSQLGYLTIEDVFENGLHEFLNQMQIEINQVGNQISKTFCAVEPVV
jgi:uncharacterized alpha-E superfamily protein